MVVLRGRTRRWVGPVCGCMRRRISRCVFAGRSTTQGGVRTHVGWADERGAGAGSREQRAPRPTPPWVPRPWVGTDAVGAGAAGDQEEEEGGEQQRRRQQPPESERWWQLMLPLPLASLGWRHGRLVVGSKTRPTDRRPYPCIIEVIKGRIVSANQSIDWLDGMRRCVKTKASLGLGPARQAASVADDEMGMTCASEQ